uniref:Uncharacterized protein n=1 Tax=Trichogramma kaykai TaxID=54128 RepID=A0ABD2W7Q3_9HYME
MSTSKVFEKLKSLRENIKWKIEHDRYEFIEKLARLIEDDWYGIDQLPNLRDIFQEGEIDQLLCDAVSYWSDGTYSNTGKKFIDFVIKTGYKDQPKLDETGKPILRHTTAVHRLGNRPRRKLARKLFYSIYTRFDVNYVDEATGMTHFHVACKNHCNGVVMKFLEFGEDPNCLVEKTGESPLHLALTGGHEKIAKLLLRRGADPNLARVDGWTPLHVICWHSDDVNVAKMFFDICDDEHQLVQVDARDQWGNTPLHFAVNRNQKELVEFLLRRGANPSLANEEGSTPLHECLTVDDNHCLVELFFEINDELNQSNRVQVDAKNKLGQTPLQLAVANIMPYEVEVLLNRGADLKSFVFPTASFGKKYETRCYDDHNKLTLAFNALAVVENLQEKIHLEQSDSLAIMKFFAKHQLFIKKSANVDKRWYDDEKFAIEVKKAMIRPNLSLYDLFRLPLEEATKLLTYKDHVIIGLLWAFLDTSEYKDISCEHLCEIISRKFFKAQAWPHFLASNRDKLTVMSCKMEFDQLMNEDLYNICLDDASQKWWKKVFVVLFCLLMIFLNYFYHKSN